MSNEGVGARFLGHIFSHFLINTPTIWCPGPESSRPGVTSEGFCTTTTFVVNPADRLRYGRSLHLLACHQKKGCIVNYFTVAGCPNRVRVHFVLR